jgi:hypothetical protein
MVTGKDDDVELAKCFISSTRFAMLAVFDLPIEWLHGYEGALKKRGHNFTGHIDSDLKEKGFEPAQIVKELGFIELEMWQIIRDSLEE